MAAKKEDRYTIKDPDADMTKNQSYALYNMTGVDVRGVALTKGAASEFIDIATTGKGKRVRLELSMLTGALVKTREVHKNFRSEKDPLGYKGIKLPAAKKPAKKADPQPDDRDDIPENNADDVGLTMAALKKMATKDPAQLIAMLSGEALPDPEPEPKTKTQTKKTNTPTARKRAAAAAKKNENEEPEAPEDKIAAALANLVA